MNITELEYVPCVPQDSGPDGSKLVKKRRRNFDGLGGGGRTEGVGKKGAYKKGDNPGSKDSGRGGKGSGGGKGDRSAGRKGGSGKRMGRS